MPYPGWPELRIISLSNQEIGLIRDKIVNVFYESFLSLELPEGEVDTARFAVSLSRHMKVRGFRFYAAEWIETGDIVGFAYGFPGIVGNEWHDLVANALGTEIGSQWMADCFDLIALAVSPRAQRQGIGGKLHDALLKGLPHRTAVLTTLQDETSAVALYRKRRWVTLAHGFAFPGRKTPYLIMGLDLQHRNGNEPNGT